MDMIRSGEVEEEGRWRWREDREASWRKGGKKEGDGEKMMMARRLGDKKGKENKMKENA